jgi:hypothetical protein
MAVLVMVCACMGDCHAGVLPKPVMLAWPVRALGAVTVTAGREDSVDVVSACWARALLQMALVSEASRVKAAPLGWRQMFRLDGMDEKEREMKN